MGQKNNPEKNNQIRNMLKGIDPESNNLQSI